MKHEQLHTIRKLAGPVVKQEELYVVDLEVKGAVEPVIWVYVDSEQGDVSVDACSRISRELSFVLDAHDIMPGKYRLNISSPGLSRPLSDVRQFRKNCGRKARIKYKNPDGYHKLEGLLKEVKGDRIKLSPDQGADVLVSLDEIVEAKIIPQFSR